MEIAEIEKTNQAEESASHHPYIGHDRPRNNLFPVFLKLEKLNTLIIGGGNVALEKLRAVVSNSPDAQIEVISKEFNQEVKEFLEEYEIPFRIKEFEETDLDGKDLVIAAVNDRAKSEEIYQLGQRNNVLVNAADTPEHCDFYLSSVVQKGSLKLAISTNGKSPTIAKRVKELLNDAFPYEIDDVLSNMEIIRKKLNGDFADKVRQLNDITSVLAVRTQPETPKRRKIVNVLTYVFSAVGLVVLGFLAGKYATIDNFTSVGNWAQTHVTSEIFIFIIGGFIAQMIDGALGMAYGVSATTFLMSFGITPAAASASVHASEIFTTGVSGISHLKFGNVNNKLFKTLVIPGVLGAIAGAYILSSLQDYAYVMKPIVACYTLVLGVIIIRKVINKSKAKKKLKKIGWLAGFGGFMDSVGGGGWGPIVTSTLIAGGRNARYTIGSVNLTEFFVSFASSVTFILMIGLDHFQVIAGLIIGGSIAAPIAARLSSKLPVKTIMLVVGIVVILVSLRIILMMIGKYL
ncbi:TSUP family transporter [Solitalea sp. MAHUQ-68]|uniref:Probable membrane transporter protein n=1 Tax=Solitalea agri TaxID=2953739 RepID=A0A9X2EYP3_9SPHI|nr:TSUP family transporter [Solitalea agri]MCO4291422.1 TSUP family transporter [Solitalea agri]